MTFQDAYDALLDRWGVPVEQLDIAGTHVNACGRLDAPPLVLLAGHGATSPVWFTVAPKLADRYRVYALDLPGDAGRSTAAPPRSVDDLITWLTTVLDGLNIPQTTLCGHSYGAWIALTYSLAHPERVGRLALIDPTDCFTGLRVSYIARALPMLLRPSQRRYESFLRWRPMACRWTPTGFGSPGWAHSSPPRSPSAPSGQTLKDCRPTCSWSWQARAKRTTPTHWLNAPVQPGPASCV
jgi:pimeloyl-ACP methyl ester carboxylesterase